ncbi:hypothetical protein ACGFNU_41920 [Spirillospora sp. NPDC048911]|uniref:hypothetical protein n=1 Tax=Spirillospora sp. NPDC048911 TaxID=3364527 RepID=UPI00371B6FD2
MANRRVLYLRLRLTLGTLSWLCRVTALRRLTGLRFYRTLPKRLPRLLRTDPRPRPSLSALTRPRRLARLRSLSSLRIRCALADWLPRLLRTNLRPRPSLNTLTRHRRLRALPGLQLWHTLLPRLRSLIWLLRVANRRVLHLRLRLTLGALSRLRRVTPLRNLTGLRVCRMLPKWLRRLVRLRLWRVLLAALRNLIWLLGALGL